MFRLNFSVVLQKRTQLTFILATGLLFLLSFSINVNVSVPCKPLWIAWCLMSCLKILPSLRTPSTGVMEDQQLPAVNYLYRIHSLNGVENEHHSWKQRNCLIFTILSDSCRKIHVHTYTSQPLSLFTFFLLKMNASHVHVGQSKNLQITFRTIPPPALIIGQNQCQYGGIWWWMHDGQSKSLPFQFPLLHRNFVW